MVWGGCAWPGQPDSGGSLPQLPTAADEAVDSMVSLSLLLGRYVLYIVFLAVLQYNAISRRGGLDAVITRKGKAHEGWDIVLPPDEEHPEAYIDQEDAQLDGDSEEDATDADQKRI